MAKFDVLYPEQPTDFGQVDIKFEGSFLVKFPDVGKCWHCGRNTQWIDISFEAHLCSEECERAKWAEYWSAEQAAIERSNDDKD